MEAVHLFPEILLHGRLSVSPFRSLEDDPGILLINAVDPDKGKPSQRAGLHQLLILQFPAHGHELLIDFLDPLFIKIPGNL